MPTATTASLQKRIDNLEREVARLRQAERPAGKHFTDAELAEIYEFLTACYRAGKQDFIGVVSYPM